MGSKIEFNDTLQLTSQQGFPEELDLKKHLKKPFTADNFAGRVFSFFDKPGFRLFHPAPLRVFLVHNVNNQWLYWGHIQIIEQTINAAKGTTTGKFVITKIYTPEHQKSMSTYEVDKEHIFNFDF
ncbi:hypothetical protein KKC17_00520 [Patescibacteria group bacterium]|nr:hypothetical protein [Patescibacteria group bacterium]